MIAFNFIIMYNNLLHYLACLAQRPEHRTCNAMVIGSNPIAGFCFSFSFHFILDNTTITIIRIIK